MERVSTYVSDYVHTYPHSYMHEFIYGLTTLAPTPTRRNVGKNIRVCVYIYTHTTYTNSVNGQTETDRNSLPVWP